jgi:hypothetical protein
MSDESGLNAMWENVPVKRSAVPDSVMDTAERIANGLTIYRDQDDRDTCALAIARAILAERERCAKVAEALGVYPELNVFAGGPEWYRHGKDIAAAIRQEPV